MAKTMKSLTENAIRYVIAKLCSMFSVKLTNMYYLQTSRCWANGVQENLHRNVIWISNRSVSTEDANVKKD